MSVWLQICSFLDACGLYFTLQLIRCVIFSIVITAIIMLLRKTVFKNFIFVKGILWSLFLIVPFLGRLKIYYENAIVVKLTWWLTEGIMTNIAIARIYMAGVLTVFIYIFGNRICLRRTISKMKISNVCNRTVYITDMSITPFTIGILRAKVILPKVMVENYSNEELQAILRHEQVHIRLGHLWCYFVWDIIRCLLWLNPFLTQCQRQFRMDLEDICDRVCIQNSGKRAHDYGLLLLKSIKLLRSENESISSAVTYTEEKDFREMKRRIEKIAAFKSYGKITSRGMVLITAVFLFTAIMVVKAGSYSRCSELDNIIVYSYDEESGSALILGNSEDLKKIITYDDNYLYVNREAFEKKLCDWDEKQKIFIVFGGFQKLPGIGGNGSTCLYETGHNDKIVMIPYEKTKDNWMTALFKLL